MLLDGIIHLSFIHKTMRQDLKLLRITTIVLVYGLLESLGIHVIGIQLDLVNSLDSKDLNMCSTCEIT